MSQPTPTTNFKHRKWQDFFPPPASPPETVKRRLRVRLTSSESTTSLPKGAVDPADGCSDSDEDVLAL